MHAPMVMPVHSEQYLSNDKHHMGTRGALWWTQWHTAWPTLRIKHLGGTWQHFFLRNVENAETHEDHFPDHDWLICCWDIHRLLPNTQGSAACHTGFLAICSFKTRCCYQTTRQGSNNMNKMWSFRRCISTWPWHTWSHFTSTISEIMIMSQLWIAVPSLSHLFILTLTQHRAAYT